MKKIAVFIGVYFVIAVFLACEKASENPAIDFSLLEQYDWQAITRHESEFLLDPTQVLSYSDTLSISFRGQAYYMNSQSTVVRTVLENGRPEAHINQTNHKAEGQYIHSAKDSVIVFTETRHGKTGGGRWSPEEVRDTTYTYTYKGRVLSLDSKALTIQYGIDAVEVAGKDTIPPFPIAYTYYAVRK